jgi:hypothetical protein
MPKKLIDYVNHLENLSDNEWNHYCKNYSKIPHIMSKKKRIIAIGDLHGDYHKSIKALKLAKVIDDNLNWVAEPKDTVVVQVGDQIDRCRPRDGLNCGDERLSTGDKGGDIKILKLFTLLHQKADKHGGAVISLLGNHEIMNVLGDMRYVAYEDLKVDDTQQRKYYFKPGNKYSKFMACTRLSAVIIGSNLFVHAGILPKLAEKYSISQINNIIILWLLGLLNTDDKGIVKKKDLDNSEFWNKLLTSLKIKENNKKLREMVNDLIGKHNKNLSPFWPRVLGKIQSNEAIDNIDCNKYLLPVLNIYNVNKMIIGHTPQFLYEDGINSTCNNKLWRVDIGMSDAFDAFDSKSDNKRKLQVLEILNDNKFNIITE